MEKQTKLKAIILSIAMVSGLLTVGHAQSDGFFRGSMESYENRDAGINSNDGTGITNYGIGEQVSLGSGLLILAAAGVGYAVVRRRRNYRHGAVMIIAFAILFTMSNCKKKVETINSVAENGVKITLTVDGGSKVIVDPTGHTNPDYATVTFESGDVIYVGNNGHYCGYLQHNGSYFIGNIDDSDLNEADYLHFYFMGNKGELSQPSSVNITDQTSKYPVISYAHSKQLYHGAGSYTAKLQNYCAMVKFTTTDIYPEITITGMNNTVSVNFEANNAADGTGIDHNPYTPSKTGEGDITLHKVSNTERWAILLPQGEVTTATASAPNYVSESAFTVPEITANMYNSVGVIVSLSKLPYIDANFTVNALGTKVHFSKGNLQAVFASSGTSTCTWRFATNQYDYVKNAVANTKVGNNQVTQAGTVDLFGWVGVHSSLAAYGINNNTTASSYGNTANEALKDDWGNVAISNGGNTANSGWRTLTNDEWVYLFNTRSNTTVNSTKNARFTKAVITTPSKGTVKGVIIFPDNYEGGTPAGVIWGAINGTSNGYSSTCTADGWEALEAAGCVFLPVAGSRGGTTVYYAGSSGYYWSSTSHESNAYSAYNVNFDSSNFDPSNSRNRNCGLSVRLVI